MAKPEELLGQEVSRWPEFVAFIKRLGVLPAEGTSRYVITVGADEIVTVQQTYAPLHETTDRREDWLRALGRNERKPVDAVGVADEVVVGGG